MLNFEIRFFLQSVEGKQLYEAYESKCARLKDIAGRQDTLQHEILLRDEQIAGNQ